MEPRIAPEDLKEIGAKTLAKGPGSFSGVSIDSRTIREGELFFAIRGPRFDGHDFVSAALARGALGVVVDHDVPAPQGAGLYTVADTTSALAALATARRARLKTKVVAITGSTGKTTTKDMTATLLSSLGPVLKTEGNLNNQYGLPLTLLKLEKEHHAAVLELGMSAAGEIAALTRIARPDVVVITNVAPVHLAFFPSVDAIAEAKAEILQGLKGVAVLNGDDSRVRAMAARIPGRALLFGKDRSFHTSAEGWRGTILGMRFTLRIDGKGYDVALPLPGPHFVMNFLAAATVGFHMGVHPEEILERALHMKAAPHRGEVRRLGESVTLIDDSYNASPFAVEAAVTTLALSTSSRKVAFLGDMLELGEEGPALHRETGEKVARNLDLLVGVAPSPQVFSKAPSVGV
jgi:UDP-N-acetylmuramoyl-tripeptide--D-alanyl-D-alanine ligase